MDASRQSHKQGEKAKAETEVASKSTKTPRLIVAVRHDLRSLMLLSAYFPSNLQAQLYKAEPYCNPKPLGPEALNAAPRRGGRTEPIDFLPRESVFGTALRNITHT